MNLRPASVLATALLVACAQTPESPSAGQALATGGYTPTGNPVLDAAMQASAQAAAQSASEAATDGLQDSTGLSQAQSRALVNAAASGDAKTMARAGGNVALQEANREAKKQASGALSGALGGALGSLGPAGSLLGQQMGDAVAGAAVDAATGEVGEAAGLTEPGAVDPQTGLAAPYDPNANAVALAAPAGATAAYTTGGTLVPGTIGEFKGRPLVPAVQSGDVKIECYYSNFPSDRDFIPMEIKVTPLVRLDEVVVKVDPEDGVVMRDGPMTKQLKTPSDPYFRRIFAMRATDRDSYLRISTVSKVSTSEAKRSVLCPLARSKNAAS